MSGRLCVLRVGGGGVGSRSRRCQWNREWEYIYYAVDGPPLELFPCTHEMACSESSCPWDADQQDRLRVVHALLEKSRAAECVGAGAEVEKL